MNSKGLFGFLLLISIISAGIIFYQNFNSSQADLLPELIALEKVSYLESEAAILFEKKAKDIAQRYEAACFDMSGVEVDALINMEFAVFFGDLVSKRNARIVSKSRFFSFSETSDYFGSLLALSPKNSYFYHQCIPGLVICMRNSGPTKIGIEFNSNGKKSVFFFPDDYCTGAADDFL